MRNLKLGLLPVVFLAISVLVLPSAVTLFAGQHTWYYKETLACEKCHADVADEFTNTENYHPGAGTNIISDDCTMCHQVEPLYPGSVSTAEGKHAATVVPCDYCHYAQANAFDNDPHYEFVNASIEDDLLPNGTESCVACHTHTKVEINFTWKRTMTFGFEVNPLGDRNDPKTAGENLWDVTEDFGYNGSETHYIWEGQAYNNSQHTWPYIPP